MAALSSSTVIFFASTLLLGIALGVAVWLMVRQRTWSAWPWLIAAMLSMFTWRVVRLLQLEWGNWFNTTIAIWGSTAFFFCMVFSQREVKRRDRAEAQRRAAEAERDALLDSERTARAEAERLSRLKDEFVGVVSHELRTPLSAILGWCDLLRSARSDAEIDEAAEVIARNAYAQRRLVEDLLDMTRLNAGTLRLAPCALDLTSVVNSAIADLRHNAEAKNVSLVADLPPKMPFAGDAQRLGQVTVNLVGNAIKFTPPGGKVCVSLRDDAGDAVLEVSDDGQGFDPAIADTLFEPFRQANATSTRGHGGLGLGLTISRNLVALHGGTLAGHSDGPGRGARFTVRLPHGRTGAPRSSEPRPSHNGNGDPSGTELAGVHVLVVEDEPDVREAVARTLEHAGATVTRVDSADAGIAAIRTASLAPKPIHVMVSDLGMPSKDGFALVRELRASGPTIASLPAIALTAFARETDRERSVAAGYDAHLSKPVGANVLVETVRQVLRAKSV